MLCIQQLIFQPLSEILDKFGTDIIRNLWPE